MLAVRGLLKGRVLLVIKIKKTQMWTIYCYYKLQALENDKNSVATNFNFYTFAHKISVSRANSRKKIHSNLGS